MPALAQEMGKKQRDPAALQSLSPSQRSPQPTQAGGDGCWLHSTGTWLGSPFHCSDTCSPTQDGHQSASSAACAPPSVHIHNSISLLPSGLLISLPDPQPLLGHTGE